LRAKPALGSSQRALRRSGIGAVVVDGAGHPLTSTITLSSIDRLALKIGDAVVVIARATNVMIGQAGK